MKITRFDASIGITVEDEGTPLTTEATTLDFVGAGVTASGTGSLKTITIPGCDGTTTPVCCTPYADCGPGFVLATEEWNVRDVPLKQIYRVAGTFPGVPAGDYVNDFAWGNRPLAGIASYNNAGDTNYEGETRSFVNHDAPTGADRVRFQAVIFGRTLAGTTYSNPLLYAIYQGTWGAATPAWGSIGTLLASGSVNPGTDTTALDFNFPVVSGRAQFVIAFGAQTHVNADVTGHDALRYPGLLSSDGQVDDSIRIHHPDYTTLDVSHYYKLEFYLECEAPLPGQPVTEAFAGDGGTTVFTTNWSYSSGSMTVRVDGVDLSADVTETDPVAGTFTFAHAPLLDSAIVVSYSGTGA